MSEIIPHMPFSEYGKRPGVNASLLKIVHRHSLLHARAYLDGGWREESDVLDFGHAFHSLALEDREEFAIKPATYTNDKGEVKPWNGNAKVCQQWIEDQGDSIILGESAAQAVRNMASVVRKELGDALNGQKELSLFGMIRGVPVKCRVDLLPDDERLPIIDLKSCKNGEPSKFLRTSIELGYLIQAAFTIDVAASCGIHRDAFELVAVESEFPHAVCRLTFTDEPLSLLKVGRIYYRAALQRLINAQESGRWDSYGQHAAEEFTPPWMREELKVTA